ncbi:MAG: DNA polymerase III subunit alpha, partial [Bdellovibrionales bacterium]|nr:DNA polymerase III subunit alpha [Bdellovibrionales bacterium]
MSCFCHLHLHTQYSVLDGAIKISELIARAKELNQPAIAVTDHGVMHGAVEFYSKARDAGIRPVIGCEVYVTTGSRHHKKQQAHGGDATHHLTLLAQNNEGYTNLCRLVTTGYIEGYYYKPRIDFELLEELSEGLICLSGCLSSELASYAKREDLDGARGLVERYARTFGDRYYLEVQPHNIREQRTLNAMCRELGQQLGIGLVATNDAHYLRREDNHAHEVLMCVSTGKLLSDEDRMRHEGAELFFKSQGDMLEELPEFEDAVLASGDIAARCDVHFDFSTYHMPRFDPPANEGLEDFFGGQARAGLQARLDVAFPDSSCPPDVAQIYRDRLEDEIKLIIKMGFPGYFLVVADFIRWAKDNGIPVGPGRGSAAGSLVAWVLRITEVDPIEHRLLFERFLNPERVSLPDIDVDFCIYGRDRVIDYVKQKYGTDKVAQICTFGTLKAKAAIRDVGRVLGLSFAETDRIAKLIPAPRQGFDYPIAEALKMEKRLREYAEGEGAELIDLAQKLEGLSRHTSTHAAGLVIADRPVVELLPLMLDKD